MSDRDSNAELARLAADLARSLRDLQRELESRPRRPPLPRDLLRFTDEVAIPGVILLLETNVRALKLLQRAIRLADDRERRTDDTDESAVRDRAVSISQATLSRLDDVLAEATEAIEGRPQNDDARRVLEEAQSLRAEIEEALAESSTSDDSDASAVTVDVDAELQSIKDDLDDREDGPHDE